MKVDNLFWKENTRGIRKKIGFKFVRINSDTDEVMIQIMKLVKHLLVSLKTDN